jgi:hypothetical protein
MNHFSAFRLQILSALALAGVAQGCAGKVDGTDEQDEQPPASQCPAPLSVSDQIASQANTCGSGVSCSGYESTTCLTPTEIGSVLLACADPPKPDRCPAVADLAPRHCSVISGEATLTGGQCCYPSLRISCAVPGRALSASGAFVLPELVYGARTSIADAGVHPDVRRILAELWCEGGRFEHASVASFARSAIQLMALGAPAELVEACQRASLDEIEHARLCFALASRFAGREIRPGKLPLDAGALTLVSLEDLAGENVIGGCIGETVAALTATAQLELASDPAVRAALETIARDEARHAELAWRIAKWASEAGGTAVRARMAAAFEAALVAQGTSGGAAPPPSAVALGHIGLAEEQRLRARILEEVVAPCASALLAA